MCHLKYVMCCNVYKWQLRPNCELKCRQLPIRWVAVTNRRETRHATGKTICFKQDSSNTGRVLRRFIVHQRNSTTIVPLLPQHVLLFFIFYHFRTHTSNLKVFSTINPPTFITMCCLDFLQLFTRCHIYKDKF